MNKVVTLAKSLINLIYPLHCASCGRHIESVNERGVCDLCLKKIKRNPLPYCPSCGRSMHTSEDVCAECRAMRPFFSSARSTCMYEGTLKELIHKFKYNNRRMLSGTFAGIMLDFIKENPDAVEGIDIITFVPLRKNRVLARGFNQSKLLASLIGKSLGIPVTECLEKTRLTKNQNELSRENRLVNLKGAFRVRPDIEEAVVRGAGILLIDDVMTTGATLNEISRVLIDRGAGKVRCLTLARGI